MTKGLEAVLDECLNRIVSGEKDALYACVAEHPELSDELVPLLRLAAGLEALREDTPPPPAGLRIGRQQLLREAARLRNMEDQRAAARRSFLSFHLQPLLRRSGLVIALVAVLVVSLLGGGTIAASANSLPGDALYAVKRLTEEVQLALTVDSEAKARLVQRLDERRREEAKAIATTQRIAEMSFRGRVESMSSYRWTIGGVSVTTSPETALQGEIAIGTFVRVNIRSLSDGTLLAMLIEAEPEQLHVQPTLSPTSSPTETRAPTEVPPTQAPTRVDARPTVAPVEAAPTSTPSRMPTPRPTATSTPTATRVPATPTPPREIKVRFRGRIEAMGANAWTVDGQEVRLHASTRIDESEERASIGSMATVLAVRQEDQSLLALEIKIEPRPPAPEQPFEFQGLIEAWSPTQWIVGGYNLTIDAATVIEGVPQRGLLAEVKAVRRADGALLAKSLVVRPPTEEVQFEGVVEAINDAEWVIEGVTVRIDARTVVVGTAAVGHSAEVQGLLLPDGAVLARRIVVQTPAPIPTHAPGPTSTP